MLCVGALLTLPGKWCSRVLATFLPRARCSSGDYLGGQRTRKAFVKRWSHSLASVCMRHAREPSQGYSSMQSAQLTRPAARACADGGARVQEVCVHRGREQAGVGAGRQQRWALTVHARLAACRVGDCMPAAMTVRVRFEANL